jgi:hypothetical protein
VAVWYIFPRFGILHKEKSGNPEANLFLPTVGKCSQEPSSLSIGLSKMIIEKVSHSGY